MFYSAKFNPIEIKAPTSCTFGCGNGTVIKISKEDEKYI
jgi:hypothetical protein